MTRQSRTRQARWHGTFHRSTSIRSSGSVPASPCTTGRSQYPLERFQSSCWLDVQQRGCAEVSPDLTRAKCLDPQPAEKYVSKMRYRPGSLTRPFGERCDAPETRERSAQVPEYRVNSVMRVRRWNSVTALRMASHLVVAFVSSMASPSSPSGTSMVIAILQNQPF